VIDRDYWIWHFMCVALGYAVSKEAYDRTIKKLQCNAATHDLYSLPGHHEGSRDWCCRVCGILCIDERQQPDLIRYSCEEWLMRQALW
jgi:hypothetical protein